MSIFRDGRESVLARHRLRGLIAQYPSLYLPLARWKYDRSRAEREHDGWEPYGGRPVGPGTDFVIEGFPRSANSFSLMAFHSSQKKATRIAHHRHVPAQVLGAAKLRIPTLVLIRNPDDAVISLVIRQPAMSLRQALKDYVRFYERIRPFSEHFVCATFEEATSDFGRVIQRVNDHFGTTFDRFEHTQENVERCFLLLERWSSHHEERSRRHAGDPESTLPRPSRERETRKNALDAELRAPSLNVERAKAHDIYEWYVRA